MSINHFRLKIATVISLCISFSFIPSVNAETCRPLNVVGGAGTKVTKRVSPPGTLLTQNNWNTDFAVPGGIVFSRYVATIMPDNDANFDIKLFLKYSDRTSSEFYNKTGVPVRANKPITLVGEPRSASAPSLVNVFVGGNSAIGNTYTVSVKACY
ncbi:MAG: hypothetical protein GPJ14_06315 [Microcystis aeruginosa G11-01]|jgi:hypothetical protein|nr:hypothetical protein [Microcystis aeruginosa G11-01]